MVLIASRIFLAILIFLFSCKKAPEKRVEDPSKAVYLVRINYPVFWDDLNFKGLETAIKRNLEYLERLSPFFEFRYGKDTYTCRDVIESQKFLLDFIKKNPTVDELNRMIMKNYVLYRAAGRAKKGDVLFTGYYEPVFEARLKPDSVFRYPIYRRPEDMIVIDLSLFSERFRGQRIIARIEGRKILPYYSREQIELQGVLKGRGLEIAYLKDPLEIMILQIQGSGKLLLPDGRVLNVGYSISNGRPFRSIGRYLVEKGYLKKDELSLQAIKRLVQENPEIYRELARYNPSYVFFKVKKDGPRGNINVVLTSGRSIALDYRLFPKGALAFIETKIPVVDSEGNLSGWKKIKRFVLNQDTGGAIRGAGRCDLFFGTGKMAGIAAGYMKQKGSLYLLVKRKGKEHPLIRKLREICYFLKKHIKVLD